MKYCKAKMKCAYSDRNRKPNLLKESILENQVSQEGVKCGLVFIHQLKKFLIDEIHFNMLALSRKM